MLCRLSTARPDVTEQYCFCRWTMWMGQLLSVCSGLKFSVGDSSDIVENPIHTTDATRKKVLSSLVGRCESGIIERFTDVRLCVLFLSIWIYITNCRIFVFIIFYLAAFKRHYTLRLATAPEFFYCFYMCLFYVCALGCWNEICMYVYDTMR